MNLVVGQKYRSTISGIIWKVLFAGTEDAVLEVVNDPRLFGWAYQPGAQKTYSLAVCEAHLRPYAPPVKPFRIRTVVAVNTVTGSKRVASIMDNYEPHRVDDPTWPTGWGIYNEVRVYDKIVTVNPEEESKR